MNEEIMPGLTKILLIGEDFPQINFEPPAAIDIEKINAVNHVLIFKDIYDRDSE